jgi:hypothetical protein
MDDHLGKCVLFSGHSGPQHSSANVLELMSMFLLFFSKDSVDDVETSGYRTVYQF